MRILYCILHTNLQKDRYENVVNTWAKNEDFIFYSDAEDLDKKIIKVSDRNDYASGQEKQINVINNLDEKYLNYDWYVFCDNDTFINTKRMNEIISELDTNCVYGHVKSAWPEDRDLHYPLGGPGILISNKVLNYIKGKLIYTEVIWSDVTLGLNLRRLGINMVDHDWFNGQPPRYELGSDFIKNHISFHYIKTFDDMNKIYEFVNSNEYTEPEKVNKIDFSIYKNLELLPPDIQGWHGNSIVFENLIKKTSPNIIIEVGSWKGQSSINMANCIKKLNLQSKIYCVDTWLGALEFWSDNPEINNKHERDLLQKNGYPQVYYQFLSNVVHSKVQDIILPFPSTSLIAARYFKSKNIKAELIYIDASHEEEDVYLDIKNYYPLLSENGIIFGDDARWSGLINAVKKFCDENNKEYYIEDEDFWIIKNK